MAQQKLNKLNIIDLSAIFVVICVVAICGIFYLHKPVTEKNKLMVTIEVTDRDLAKTISSAADSDKNVYFNSTDFPVNLVNTAYNSEILSIILDGPGHIDSDGDIFFNGQRILIGQKAEIHASYFAQGKIVKVENAN